MPYLRDAVEKQRQYYIHLLINGGIYKKGNEKVQTMTLTELQTIYQQHKKEINRFTGRSL